MPSASMAASVAAPTLPESKRQRTVPSAFTAGETFDVGVDLGSPGSLSRSASPGVHQDCRP